MSVKFLSAILSGISTPMVWVRVAFHENDGNHENDENDKDNSDSYKQGVECWIRGNHGNHENDENHENPGCKPRVPQTIGLEIPDSGAGNDCANFMGAWKNALFLQEKPCHKIPRFRGGILGFFGGGGGGSADFIFMGAGIFLIIRGPSQGPFWRGRS